jgi:hypothetical protein
MTTYPDDADGAALANLAEQGVDMSQPLDFDFPVAAPDEAAAIAIQQALAAAGYASEVEYDEGDADDGDEDEFGPDDEDEMDADDEEVGPSWAVYVNLQMVPEYDEVMRIQAELDRLAQPLGGYSDGWGVLMDEE